MSWSDKEALQPDARLPKERRERLEPEGVSNNFVVVFSDENLRGSVLAEQVLLEIFSTGRQRA
jgi:hypothetical protein